MKHRDLGRSDGQFLIVFDDGDEIGVGIADFARSEGIQLASFTAIGALSAVELMAFDAEAKVYRTAVRLDEQCELASLVGNLAMHDGEVLVHAHLVIGKSDGAAFAGHLKTAVVRPTCEVFLTVHPAVAAKREDPRWGLPLYDLDTPGPTAAS